jgi:hypothetical protein
MMNRPTWKRCCESTILACAAALALSHWTTIAWAVIPDANIVAGVNRAGFGVIAGVYGQADFPLSERSALGGYFGFDENDLFFGEYGPDDDTIDGDLVAGGHYMHQFVEGTRSTPSVTGIFGVFANRAGLRPEVGFGLSYPFDPQWTGRANFVYGPSWGFEVGYRFSRSVEGTFGITGLGVVGLGFRF